MSSFEQIQSNCPQLATKGWLAPKASTRNPKGTKTEAKGGQGTKGAKKGTLVRPQQCHPQGSFQVELLGVTRKG